MLTGATSTDKGVGGSLVLGAKAPPHMLIWIAPLVTFCQNIPAGGSPAVFVQVPGSEAVKVSITGKRIPFSGCPVQDAAPSPRFRPKLPLKPLVFSSPG